MPNEFISVQHNAVITLCPYGLVLVQPVLKHKNIDVRQSSSLFVDFSFTIIIFDWVFYVVVLCGNLWSLLLSCLFMLVSSMISVYNGNHPLKMLKPAVQDFRVWQKSPVKRKPEELPISVFVRKQCFCHSTCFMDE